MDLSTLCANLQTAVGDVEAKKKIVDDAAGQNAKAIAALQKAVDDAAGVQAKAVAGHRQAIDAVRDIRRQIDAALAGVVPAEDGRVR